MITDTTTASEQITDEVTSWPGVTAAYGDHALIALLRINYDRTIQTHGLPD